jgi:hypothetical protein
MGNTGASMSGDIGFPLGPNGGCMGVGRSGARLYHCVGISDASKYTLLCSAIILILLDVNQRLIPYIKKGTKLTFYLRNS